MTDTCGWTESFIQITRAPLSIADEWFKAFPDTSSEDAAHFYIIEPSAKPTTVSEIITKYATETTPTPSFHQQLDFYRRRVRRPSMVYSGLFGFIFGALSMYAIRKR